jgi:hypothetical protein
LESGRDPGSFEDRCEVWSCISHTPRYFCILSWSETHNKK